MPNDQADGAQMPLPTSNNHGLFDRAVCLSSLARKFDDVFLMLPVGGSRRDLAVGTGAC